MKARSKNDKAIRIQLPGNLYQRVERAAVAAQRSVPEMIVSALETGLPILPDSFPSGLKDDLSRWAVLDNEALRAIATAFLPQPKQRRFTTLLRKAEAEQLTAREQAEWERLQQEYLRFSQNKAKAQFLLAEREKNKQIEETAA